MDKGPKEALAPPSAPNVGGKVMQTSNSSSLVDGVDANATEVYAGDFVFSTAEKSQAVLRTILGTEPCSGPRDDTQLVILELCAGILPAATAAQK